jgi:hypothetical protein
MSVSGKWVNAFGSVVYLDQVGTGVVGVYASTTGSSGAYWVVGVANPNPPAGAGESLALSILWRSFQGGTGDPSWHYVSGFSGQRITLNNTPTLSLIHDMVATTPFPGVVPVPGSYLDKLLYTPYAGSQAQPGNWPPRFCAPAAATPIDGIWTSTQTPDLKLTLAVEDLTFGYVTGSLQTPDGTVALAGFTDTYAGSGGLRLQGLTLNALLPDNQTVVALAGSLDLKQNLLTLSWLQSSGTAAGSTWIQTSLQSLTFTRT